MSRPYRSVLYIPAANQRAMEKARTLAADAWEKAKIKGADLAEDAVDAVKARPVAAGGVAAAIALFLAREPIKDAAVKIYDAMTSRRVPEPPAPALSLPHQPDPTVAPAAPAGHVPPKTEIVI